VLVTKSVNKSEISTLALELAVTLCERLTKTMRGKTNLLNLIVVALGEKMLEASDEFVEPAYIEEGLDTDPVKEA